MKANYISKTAVFIICLWGLIEYSSGDEGKAIQIFIMGILVEIHGELALMRSRFPTDEKTGTAE